MQSKISTIHALPALLCIYQPVCQDNIILLLQTLLLNEKVGKKKHKQKMRIRKEPCPPPRHIIGCTFFCFFNFLGEGGEKKTEKRKRSRAPTRHQSYKQWQQIQQLHERVGKKKHKQKMRIRKEPCPPPRHIIGCTFFCFFNFLGEGGEKKTEKRKRSRAPTRHQSYKQWQQIQQLHERVGKKKHKQKMRIRKEPCPPPRHIIGCTFFCFFFNFLGGEKKTKKRKESRAPTRHRRMTV